MASPKDQFTKPSTLADYLPALQRYLTKHLPRDDVDDAAQEVLLRVHQRQTEAPIDNITGYIFQVAASVVMDRARRDKVRHRGDHLSLEEFHHPVEQLTPHRVLVGREDMSRLVDALQDMPERYRDVFVLHRFEHLSYPEIATHMGVSISAVGKYMMKALVFLAQRDLP
jgi:RNA polymerase sigma-70 factor (ECF subfamily)